MPSKEERDEPEFPKLRSSSRVTLILGPTPLDRVRPLSPNVNLLTTVDLFIRSGCRQGVVMRRSCFLQMVLKLTSAGERMTKKLRGTQTGQTWWNQRETSSHVYSIWWCLPNGLARMALGVQALKILLGKKLSRPSFIS